MTASTELPTRFLAAGLLGSALLMGVLAGVDPALAIGVSFGLVLLVIAMANLTAGICLLAFLTFLDAILPADAGGALSVSKLVGLALVLSWFALVTTGERERREQLFSPPAFLLVLVFFVGWTAVSAVWAEDAGAAITATTRYLPNAMLFLVVFAGVRTRQQLLWVVGSLVAGAIVAAVYGMVVGAPQDDPGRVAIGNANETAASLVMGGTLAAALAFALRGRPALKLLTVIAVPLCVFAVFLTLSRGGLVALGASLTAAIVVAGRRRGPLLGLAAAAVLATVLYFGAFAPAEARDRLLELEGGTGRTDIWTVGWRMVTDNPLAGVGADNFPVASIHYLLEPGALMRTDFIVDDPKVAHNTYLNVLAELGIVGFILLLVIIAIPLRCAAQAIGFAARAGDRQLEVLARAMVVVIVGVLAAAFFGSRQYSKQLWLVLSLGPVLLQVTRAELASRHAESAAAGRSPSAPPA